MKKLLNIILAITPISLILCFINPQIAWILNILCCVALNVIEPKLKEITKPDNRPKEIKITLENCETFLRSKSNKMVERIEREKTTSQELSLDILANDILQSYINSSEPVLYTYVEDDEVRELLIKMLQEDIGTDEKNISKLLWLAKQKLATENLESELNLSRKAGKIPKKQ